MDKLKHVIVLGAGLSGLTATYDLLRAGHRVTILEASPFIGGLASSFHLRGKSIERFYHFICRADRDLIEFVNELGLSDNLHWRRIRTAFYHQGYQYSFGTPMDLVRFSAIPAAQRIRFGLHIIQSRNRSDWTWLDKLPAKPWLIENIGEQAYNVIWHPLLKIKFGEFHEKISAAWVWHRIWRVAQSRRYIWEHESFGYMDDGSSTIIDRLANLIRSHHKANILEKTSVLSIEILDNQAVSVISERGRQTADAIISTFALPILSRFLPDLQLDYFKKLKEIQYIGVVCVLFNLTAPFSRNFWMNINDPKISFNGIIEQTNLNHNLQAAGLNLIYVPFYLPTNEPRFQASDSDLFEEYVPMLKRINPSFNDQWIRDYFVFRTAHAQAICTTNFRESVPEIRSPIKRLYITDSTQFYPEDRTISAAIRQGRRAARLVIEDFADGL